jgi:hypothetical protein
LNSMWPLSSSGTVTLSVPTPVPSKNPKKALKNLRASYSFLLRIQRPYALLAALSTRITPTRPTREAA